MAQQKQPFNIKIMDTKAAKFKNLRRVTTMDIYEGRTANFHPDGLFSTEIFGRVGTPGRMNNFSYVELNTVVLHPFIVKTLKQIKRLYHGILQGKDYAVWDDQNKDFIASDELNGETGYSFFMTHWGDIKFKPGKSEIRTVRIEMLDKYRKESLTTKWVIIPAGLRDISVDKKGKLVEGDINTPYRKLMAIANTINKQANVNDELYDVARWSMSKTLVEIYEMIEKMLVGKKGLMQGKWARRGIYNATRNVITSMDMAVEDLDSPRSIEVTDSFVGLFQLMKAALPLTINKVRTTYLPQIFVDQDNVNLVNKETLQSERVSVDTEVFDTWNSVEGLENLIDRYSYIPGRNQPIEIDGYYLALIYQDEVAFKVFNSIDDLPKKCPKENVRPITYTEFFYLSGLDIWGKILGIFSRYPIVGLGSTYPTTLKVKTTVESLMLKRLNEEWEPSDLPEDLALEFPIATSKHFETFSPSLAALEGLGADFDGDMGPMHAIIMDESSEEIRNFFDSPNSVLDPRGGTFADITTLPILWAVRSLTKEPDGVTF